MLCLPRAVHQTKGLTPRTLLAKGHLAGERTWEMPQTTREASQPEGRGSSLPAGRPHASLARLRFPGVDCTQGL